MSYPLGMTYAGRKRADNAEEIVNRLATLYEEKQRRNTELDGPIADTIAEAVAANVSLRQMAAKLGVSPETVRKMGAAK